MRRTVVTLVAGAVALVTGLGAAAPAAAGPQTASLRANEQLNAGQQLITTNGVTLVMQADGRLVEYAPGNRAVWWVTTNRPGTLLRMQADGNLVLVVPGNVTVWSTRTAGNPGASLELQTDGAATVRSTRATTLWTNGVRITVPTTPTTAPPTTTTRPTSAPPTTTTPAGTPADQVVALTNAQRTSNGCAALPVDARLTSAAQGHATDMAGSDYFSHTSLDGRTFDQRIRNAGYPRPGGENIAKGQTSASEVMTAWMNSSGHRANILNCSFTAIGVGFDARGNYWVQNFGY